MFVGWSSLANISNLTGSSHFCTIIFISDIPLEKPNAAIIFKNFLGVALKFNTASWVAKQEELKIGSGSKHKASGLARKKSA